MGRPCSNGTAAAWQNFYVAHSKRGTKPTRAITAFRDRHYLRKSFAGLMPADVQASPGTHVAPLDQALLCPLWTQALTSTSLS